MISKKLILIFSIETAAMKYKNVKDLNFYWGNPFSQAAFKSKHVNKLIYTNFFLQLQSKTAKLSTCNKVLQLTRLKTINPQCILLKKRTKQTPSSRNCINNFTIAQRVEISIAHAKT